MIIISSILIILSILVAILCRSLVHTLLHHYDEFDKKFNVNDKWWDPKISWKQKYKTDENFELILDVYDKPIRNKKIIQTSDAFHFFNTTELGAYDFIISSLMTFILCLYFKLIIWVSIIVFVGLFLTIGLVLMALIFNLGYDKLWR